MTEISPAGATSPSASAATVPSARLRIVDVKSWLVAMCERFGFQPVEMPLVAPTELFGGRPSKDALGPVVVETAGDEPLALRSDFTPLIARLFKGERGELEMPARLQYESHVFRPGSDSPTRREIAQCGTELIGVKDSSADGQMACPAISATRDAGVPDAVLTLGHIGVVAAMVRNSDLPEAAQTHLRAGVVHHRALIDAARLAQQVAELASAEDASVGARIGRVIEFIKRLHAAAGPAGEAHDRAGQALDEFGRDASPLADVQAIVDMLAAQGIHGDSVHVDLSLGCGAMYYTGVVFEVNDGSGRTLGRGGRYDRLIGELGGDEIPAVGCTLRVDTVAAASTVAPAPTALVVVEVGEDLGDAVRIAVALREAGISCETIMPGIDTPHLARATRTGRRRSAARRSLGRTRRAFGGSNLASAGAWRVSARRS